jgi:hypothetical protein
MRVVAFETIPLHDGKVAVIACKFLPLVTIETELLYLRLVQPAVEAVTRVAPAVGERPVAPGAQERCQARAVRVVAGKAGSAVAAYVLVGTEKVLVIALVALVTQGVALFGEHQLLFVAVIEVAFEAFPVLEGRVDAPVSVPDVAQLVTFFAEFLRRRGNRGEGETEDQQESQDAARSHSSIPLSFMVEEGRNTW